ncbi:phosphoprotein [Harbour porpoise rhabdovirus]|uniref:Phosphoprotein n=1 Tax=Harbour porpoise rhabdovirus TaxID=2598784 RepID=A0AAE6M1B7_9RHAB|nr:phosphoprotein [Harbour porpoise rhabdovirus]QDZ59978.1 phosphoprotein [Harbour porpoise rhabdovirus]
MFKPRELKIPYDLEKLEEALKEADTILNIDEGNNDEKMSELDLNKSLENLLEGDEWAEQPEEECENDADDEGLSASEASDVDLNPSDDAWETDPSAPPQMDGYHTKGFKFSSPLTPVMRKIVLQEVNKVVEPVHGILVPGAREDNIDYYVLYPIRSSSADRTGTESSRSNVSPECRGAEGGEIECPPQTDPRPHPSPRVRGPSNKCALIWENGIQVEGKDGKSKTKLKPERLGWSKVEWFANWDEKDLDNAPIGKICQHVIRRSPIRATLRRKYHLD